MHHDLILWFAPQLWPMPSEGGGPKTCAKQFRRMYRQGPAFLNAACGLPAPGRGGKSLSQRLSSADQRAVLPLLATLRRADVAALRNSTALVSTNRGIRAAAYAALGRVGTSALDAGVLLQCLRGGDDHSVRAAAAAALGELHAGGETVPGGGVLAELEERAVRLDENFIVRYSAIAALGSIGGASAVDTLVAVGASPLEMSGAIAALTDIPGAEQSADARQYVLALADHTDDLVRGAVARALGTWARAGRVELVPVLEDMQLKEEQLGNSVHVENMLAQALFDLPGSAAGG